MCAAVRVRLVETVLKSVDRLRLVKTENTSVCNVKCVGQQKRRITCSYELSVKVPKSNHPIHTSSIVIIILDNVQYIIQSVHKLLTNIWG
jgi:hypothetical protein